jgi:hypothetical protein
MSKKVQGGKKKAGRRPPRKKSTVEVAPPEIFIQPSRSERIKGMVHSIMGKVAHDGAADIIKKVLQWGAPGGGSLLLAAAMYFGVPVPSWLEWRHPQIETGSIKKEQGKPLADEQAKKREIECEVAKARKVDALTERRKGAWATYTSCKSDWSPGWFDKRTAEEACAPKLQVYRDLAQQVQDEQAKDCSVTARK